MIPPMTLPAPRALLPLLVALLVAPWLGAVAGAEERGPVERGETLFRAAGGCGCHTDYERGGKLLAGGRPLQTPFGTFYGSNLTPHRETGLGSWSEADFLRAMRQGLAPGGRHLFPVFPFTSFTGMSNADLTDLWAYLRSVPPVARANTPHDVWPPFGWRWSAGLWKRLFFKPGPYRPKAGKSDQWNRGAYLVNALGHCGECHTPRNLAGALKPGMHLAGSRDGPEGHAAPNLTPHDGTGIGDWSREDIVWYLQTGSDPDGDSAEGLMEEMIEHGFSELSEADLMAIVVYLKSLSPIDNAVVVKEN
jgi:mono/diheme cytochrome c family protein